MLSRSVAVEPATLVALRVAAAIWLVIEWLLMVFSTIVTVVVSTADDLTDWEVAAFTIWTVLLVIAPPVLAIGLFTNLRGELRDWLRKLSIVLAAASLLGGVWWTASLDAGSPIVANVVVAVGWLISTAVTAAVALTIPRLDRPPVS